MASVAKRPDGRWRARYRDGDGKEHARHFTRKTDAQRWLDEVTASVVTGQYVDPNAGRVTFRAYAEQWRQAAPHGAAMRDKVARTLERHVYPVLGDKPIGAIRPTAVQGWVTGLALAPSSAKVALGYVSSVFRAAVRDRVIMSNPAEGVRPPAARRGDVYIPSLSAVIKLRSNLPDRYRAAVDLVIGSGLRQGEVFGLEVDGVDFLRGRALAVRQQLVSLSPEPLHLAPPKTAESKRIIPLARSTLDTLSAHLAAHAAREVEIEDRTDPQRTVTRTARLMFTTDAGSPISRSMWSQIWRPAARAAGIPERVGLHALRHFYASALIQHGESVKVVQKRLGHSSAVVTLDTYAHLWPDSDDRTRDAVEAALSASADSVRTESG
jgi:integrase